MKNLLKTFRKYGGWIFGIVWTISFFTMMHFIFGASEEILSPVEEGISFIAMMVFSAVIGLIASFLICWIIDFCKKESNNQTKEV